jgi:hypothetical protein
MSAMPPVPAPTGGQTDASRVGEEQGSAPSRRRRQPRPNFALEPEDGRSAATLVAGSTAVDPLVPFSQLGGMDPRRIQPRHRPPRLLHTPYSQAATARMRPPIRSIFCAPRHGAPILRLHAAPQRRPRRPLTCAVVVVDRSMSIFGRGGARFGASCGGHGSAAPSPTSTGPSRSLLPASTVRGRAGAIVASPGLLGDRVASNTGQASSAGDGPARPR